MNNVRNKTVSAWSYFLEHVESFKNPFYKRDKKVLKVNSLHCNMRFWKEHFLQYSAKNDSLGFTADQDYLVEFYKDLAMKYLKTQNENVEN